MEPLKETKQPEITVPLVEDLIKAQFPEWSDLPVRPVKQSGWDNRTFHLGKEMSVRLPSAERYAAKVHIEQEWLPKLARHLSYPIPEPLAMGQPSQHYPWHWSVYKWIDGENADTLHANDLEQFAEDSATFLRELYRVDTTGGPLAGPHNFYRGASPSVYDDETRTAISRLKDVIDANVAMEVWEKAISSEWNKDAIWIHGDFSAGNILVKDGKLTAVIDFGGMGIGDPACDLVIAWTLLNAAARQKFKLCLNLDDNTWARARGWCLWKALITLVSLDKKDSPDALRQLKIIRDVSDEHKKYSATH